MSRVIDVFKFTGSEMREKGNFFALMFLVMALGALVTYFVLGWSSNVVAQVRKAPGHLSYFDDLLTRVRL